jgi:hypothetical protein
MEPQQSIASEPAGWLAGIAAVLTALGGGKAIHWKVTRPKPPCQIDMACIADEIRAMSDRLDGTIRAEQTATRERFETVMGAHTDSLARLIDIATRPHR